MMSRAELRCVWASLFASIAFLISIAIPESAFASDAAQTYRCWSFNVGGRAGRCQTSPPIVLNSDGTYQESSASGRYTISGDQIVFSGSTIRGPGRIKDNTIVFEYVYKNLPHTVTYLQSSGPPLTSGSAPKDEVQRQR